MRTYVIRVLVLLAAVAVGCGGGAGVADHPGGDGNVAWGNDLHAALQRASSERKPVMVDFYTDWCRWCVRLDQTTYADRAVRTALRRVIPVKLDAERGGREQAERYGVDGYPTVIFLDAQGQELGRIPGYLPPRPFLRELDDILGGV
jgi:thiol:disulfide interchange protein